MKKIKFLSLSTLTVLPVSALFIVSCQQTKTESGNQTNQPTNPAPASPAPLNTDPNPVTPKSTTPSDSNPKDDEDDKDYENQISDEHFDNNENDSDYSKVKAYKENEVSKKKAIFKKILVPFYKWQGNSEEEANKKATEFINKSTNPKELKVLWYKFIRSQQVRNFVKTAIKQRSIRQIGKLLAKEIFYSLKEVIKRKKH
ncbi:hypothetical protein [Mycoplasma sp. 5370]